MSEGNELAAINQGTSARRLDPAEVERTMALRQAAEEERDRITAAWHAGELTDEAARTAMAAATWPKWSISTLGPCPPGCRTEHDPEGADDDLVGHEVEVGRFETVHPDHQAYVSWGFCDALIEGKRCAAQVQVYGADEGLTVTGARQLAAAVLEAALAVEAWNTGRERAPRAEAHEPWKN